MIASVLIIVLLLLVVFLAYREGRPFFNDALKIFILVCVILLALLVFVPNTMGGIR